MANTTTNKNTKQIEQTSSESEKIKTLEQENREMKKRFDELLEMFEQLKAHNDAVDVNYNTESINDYNEIPEEPSPNKMIRVLSMFRGSLNLSEDDSGAGKVKFSKYGEIKTILYSSLINIVNHNRTFAEKGMFYILDKSAVYYLGLKDCYNKLKTKDVLDEICKYDDVDIEKIISDTEKSQIDTMVKNLADRLYAGEKLDLNKIALISKKSGFDIMNRVKEMEKFSK